MDYEKKYKNALTIARSRFKIEKDESVLICLGMMFPELFESEDERIREKMVEHFKSKTKDTWCNMPVKSILDWLEKQKEQKPAEWSEEDEAILDSLIRLYSKEYVGEIWPWGNGKFTYGDVAVFLKSLRPSWKPSEEDKEMKLKILKYLSTRCSVEQFEEVEGWLNNKLK